MSSGLVNSSEKYAIRKYVLSILYVIMSHILGKALRLSQALDLDTTAHDEPRNENWAYYTSETHLSLFQQFTNLILGYLKMFLLNFLFTVFALLHDVMFSLIWSNWTGKTFEAVRTILLCSIHINFILHLLPLVRD